ncbi:MAG: RidA family protein [Hyphomonadaceae bacterium]
MKVPLFALALLALPAAASAQSAREAIVPDWHRETTEALHYAPAVRAGDLLFLAGVVAGRAPGETDDVAAYTRAFEGIARVLEASGSDWDHVVEMTTYHTDLPAQIEAFASVKDRFVQAPYPAWTAIDIDRLYPDNGLVEIKVIARVRSAE